MRRPGAVRRAARARAAAALIAALAPTGARAACKTVDGAPAATSEPLVLGMLRQMQARDEAGVRKFLDTGQALLLRGGHPVEVLQRNPQNGTLVFRRGPNQLWLWTLDAGIACEPDPPRTHP